MYDFDRKPTYYHSLSSRGNGDTVVCKEQIGGREDEVNGLSGSSSYIRSASHMASTFDTPNCRSKIVVSKSPFPFRERGPLILLKNSFY